MKYLCALLVPLLFCPPVTFGAETPVDSIYQVESEWQNQDGLQLPLSDLRGKLQLVAFVYTFCEHTCPLIVSQIESVLRLVDEDVRPEVHVTLITLAPERDKPSQLKAYMQKRGLDEDQWTMLTGNAGDVRVLANLFDVKYQPMEKDQLAHSNLVTLLDKNGVIQARLLGLDSDKNKLVREIMKLARRS